MKAIKIKEDVYWVGAIDWNLRNFHGYQTQRGSSYNAYLILDEKKVLVDTVKEHFCGEMLGRIKNIIDPAEIDYVISNHAEMDHSGSLPEIMKICKNAQLIVSPHGEKALRSHFKEDWNFKVVKTGDSISIGKRALQFVLMPLVHWPDSMATYIPEEKLLLPNDAFGQHVASPQRFDDELGWDIAHHEAAKYYANIALVYSKQVRKILEDIAPLDIEMIAPSHGVIWRDRVKDIIEQYRKWSHHETENKAVVVYDTMWGSTEKMAQAIYQALDEKGIQCRLLNLQVNHYSDVMTEILTSKYICVGSPTLNSGMLPSVASFLCYLKGLAPQQRVGLSFGSYGWGGQSIKEVHDILESCEFKVMEPLQVQYVPDDEMLKRIKEDMAQRLH